MRHYTATVPIWQSLLHCESELRQTDVVLKDRYKNILSSDHRNLFSVEKTWVTAFREIKSFEKLSSTERGTRRFAL